MRQEAIKIPVAKEEESPVSASKSARDDHGRHDTEQVSTQDGREAWQGVKVQARVSSRV